MTGRSQRLVQLVDGRVRAHTVTRVKRKELQDDGTMREVSVFALDDLVRRLQLLIASDAEHPAADGFGSSTPGNGSPGSGKGGGRVMVIDDENGQPDRVPTSSTEAAAVALVMDRPPADPVHTLAVQAMKAFETVANQLVLLNSALTRFDHLRELSKVPDPPQCFVAQVRHHMQWDPEWEPWRETDFAGKLDESWPEPRKVCKFVYWFVHNHKRLPSRNEMLRQLERGVVNVKAS